MRQQCGADASGPPSACEPGAPRSEALVLELSCLSRGQAQREKSLRSARVALAQLPLVATPPDGPRRGRAKIVNSISWGLRRSLSRLPFLPIRVRGIFSYLLAMKWIISIPMYHQLSNSGSSTGSSQVLTSEAFIIQSDQHVESFSTLHDQGVRSCSFSRQPCGKGTAHARPDLCTKGRHCPVTAESPRVAPRSLCDLSPPHRLCSKEHTAFSV